MRATWSRQSQLQQKVGPVASSASPRFVDDQDAALNGRPVMSRRFWSDAWVHEPDVTAGNKRAADLSTTPCPRQQNMRGSRPEIEHAPMPAPENDVVVRRTCHPHPVQPRAVEARRHTNGSCSDAGRRGTRHGPHDRIALTLLRANGRRGERRIRMDNTTIRQRRGSSVVQADDEERVRCDACNEDRAKRNTAEPAAPPGVGRPARRRDGRSGDRLTRRRPRHDLRELGERERPQLWVDEDELRTDLADAGRRREHELRQRRAALPCSQPPRTDAAAPPFSAIRRCSRGRCSRCRRGLRERSPRRTEGRS